MQCEVNKGPVHVNEFLRYHRRENSPLFSTFSNRSSSSFARRVITARISLWFVTEYRQQYDDVSNNINWLNVIGSQTHIRNALMLTIPDAPKTSSRFFSSIHFSQIPKL